MHNLFDLFAAVRKPYRKHLGEITTYQVAEGLSLGQFRWILWKRRKGV
jgi:hypothetical protein